jgi:hypothetical protein
MEALNSHVVRLLATEKVDPLGPRVPPSWPFIVVAIFHSLSSSHTAPSSRCNVVELYYSNQYDKLLDAILPFLNSIATLLLIAS